MKYFFLLIVLSITLSCESSDKTNGQHHESFENRTVAIETLNGLESGKTYLPIYSQIESHPEHKTHYLTVTATIRNINQTDTIFITGAEYLDTDALPIHTYFDNPVYVAPFETLEMVIHKMDQKGREGNHFIFDWKKKSKSIDPHFQGVMISTHGSQGIALNTQGKRIE